MTSLNDRNKNIINEFRTNNGKVGGPFEGRQLLLLHTIGAKSKQVRINPVAYTTDGDRLVVIASKGGSDSNPDWYYNLVANPQVTVEVGTEKFQAEARITTEPEQTRLYNKMIEVMPGFAEYRRRTKRQIPVITLLRVE